MNRNEESSVQKVNSYNPVKQTDWSREELYILAREFGIPNYQHIQEEILIEMLARRLN